MKLIKMLVSLSLLLTLSACTGNAGKTPQNQDAGTSSSGADQNAVGSSLPEQHGSLLYLGHASLRITTPENKVIYIDPFAGNAYDLPADLILVTHDHYDHTSLDKIAYRADDCAIVTWKEALRDGVHQTFDFGFARVEAVEAGFNRNHSVKNCVGYLITLSDGVTIYVSGDTSTTDQMPSLAERSIDYAFYCCDGVYNMDLEEAAACAKIVSAKHDIPYHVIPADGEKVFDRQRAEAFDSPRLLVVEPGQEIALD